MRRSKTCECGCTYVVGSPEDEAVHGEQHEEFLLGPDIPEFRNLKSIVSKDSLKLVLVNNSSNQTIRGAIAKVAEVAQRCSPDFKSGYYGSNSENETNLYALVKGTRIAGMVITSLETRFSRYKWDKEGGVYPSEHIDSEDKRVKIARIWIAQNYRRQRWANWLINEISDYTGCATQDLIWEMPLTANGASFIKSMYPEAFSGCGDVFLGECIIYK